MTSSGNTKNQSYTIRALYEIIKPNLLVKDKDLIHFINTMNDAILDEYNNLKKSVNLNIHDISNRFEHYTIVFMMIRSIMRDANISNYNDKAREITDLFLVDILKKKQPPNQSLSTEDE